MRGLPFVPFFTSDWLASSARADMSPLERAIYLDLLFHIWDRDGAIPANHAKLARLANVDLADFESAWPILSEHLVPHPDDPTRLTNLKMLNVMDKQKQVHVVASNNGRRGGLAKARNRNPKRSESASEHASEHASESSESASENASEHASESLANLYHLESESESESESEREAETNTSASDDARDGQSYVKTPTRKALSGEQSRWFEEWWSEYPRKKDRGHALKAFKQHVRTQEQFDAVLAGLKRQLPELLARSPEYVPYPATWLNGQHWLNADSPVKLDPFEEALRLTKEEEGAR